MPVSVHGTVPGTVIVYVVADALSALRKNRSAMSMIVAPIQDNGRDACRMPDVEVFIVATSDFVTAE